MNLKKIDLTVKLLSSLKLYRVLFLLKIEFYCLIIILINEKEAKQEETEETKRGDT